MTKAKTTEQRHELHSQLRWVALGDMRVSPAAQREFQPNNPAIVNDFDPELLGHPVLSERGSHFYILDGQHRIMGFRAWIGDGWREQQILCRVYVGLSEEDEADLFLKLNDVKAISAFDKFRVGVNAQRDVETDIDRIVRALGLKVSKQKTEGGVGAVGTLRKVYSRGGPAVLSRTLRILRDAYGDAGMDAPFIDGIGLVTSRYNGEVDEAQMVQRLASVRQGTDGLMQQAYVLKRASGSTLPHSVAAAAVEIYNKGRGGRKLPSWWRSDS